MLLLQEQAHNIEIDSETEQKEKIAKKKDKRKR